MKNGFKTILACAGIAAGSLGAASAATVTPGVGTYTFSGPSTLSGLGNNFSCTLTLVGDVQKDGNGGVVVTVTDGSASGSFFSFCNIIGFEFPWTANVSAAQIPADPTQPVAIMFDNVEVSVVGMSCTNGQPVSIPAMYSNGDPISDPSSFTFNANIGSCGVVGSVSAQTDVNVTQ
ncbi:hypothetical protein C84B14_11891 [Salinisphaera sp. C84B14]|uniref:hypothetical protein n=1 Tax=unclassified Salinisphaera TaxID=2649847 RepID=UPI000C529FC6|nr:hypothetical protein [Salinisphaera sp.]MBS64373.1 hypothetical protein [Salinisphaera sp.]